MKKILVIEDNFEVRENLQEILELDGYEVFTAVNGKKGVEQAREQMPDLILCDVMMPELDGFGVLNILNRSTDLNHIPLIFLTAKAEKEDFRKGMGLGADDYITKPFDDVQLLNTIELRLKKSERLQNNVDNSSVGIQNFFSEIKAQKAIEDLSKEKEIRIFSAKDRIYEEGSNPRLLFYIEEGEVKLTVQNEVGKEMITQLLGKGDFMGAIELISNSAYQQSANCLSDVKLRLIPKEDFLTVLYNNRDLGVRFIKLLANKTQSIEQKLISLAYDSVRQKIVEAILQYAESLKIREDSFQVNLTRDELSQMAGTTKESAIRTLSDFKTEQLIKIENKIILVKSKKKLRQIIA